MELSNPLFSNKFFFNQWLPYILVNNWYLCTAEKKPHFRDGMIALQILLIPGPQACNLQKIAWLLSFIASQLQRNIWNCISFYNDGIYIFWNLVSKMQQRSWKVLVDFFFLTLIVRIMGAAYLQVWIIHECLW